MLLAIDVGNTNVVFALFNNEKLLGTWRCETKKKKTADEYAVWLMQIFQIHNINTQDISGIIISNVVPETSLALQILSEKYFKKKPIIVGDQNLKYNIKLFPELGADLVANAVAGYHIYHDNLIIIDFGTATTTSIIHKEGVYIGGQIAPGIHLSRQALTQAASQLPTINIKKPKTIVCKDTTEAMQSGLYWGYVGLVEKLIEQTKKEQKRDYKVIATGGLASLIADDTSDIDIVDDDLLFKGLRILYQIQSK